MTRVLRADAVRNRTKILEAAREQISRFGADAQMADISKAAGVAVGTLYRHFPTKQDLVAAVVSEYVEQVNADARAALDRVVAGARPLDEVAAFLTRVIEATARVQAVKALATADHHASETRAEETEAAQVVDQLISRARDLGDLRADITVEDLYLLIAAAPLNMASTQRERWVHLMMFGLASDSR